MRYLGIDYGFKRLGVAMCDPSETIVSPLCQLPVNRSRLDRVFAAIGQIVAEYGIAQVVVGLPLNMDGSEGAQAKVTRQFAEALGSAVGVEVHFQDERLSSAAADEMLSQGGLPRNKRKTRRDMLAACTILQEFLGRTKEA